MFKYFILLAFSVIGLTSIAQVKQDEESVVVKANRSIPEAYRIVESPKIIDTVIPQSEVEYPLLSLKYETKIILDTIEPATVKLVDKFASRSVIFLVNTTKNIQTCAVVLRWCVAFDVAE